jgi:hypothetical protein
MTENTNAGQHIAAAPTPNVVIENPQARKIVRTTLDVIGGAAAIAQAVDFASPAFDLSPVLVPLLAGYAVARAVFGFAVDNPNTPKV